MKRLPVLATCLVLLAVFAGCTKSTLPTDVTPLDTVALTSITPAAGTKLAPGSMVTFTATLSYSLTSASSGAIVMAIQDQNNVPLNTGAQKSATVNAGTGTVTLTDQITVPATGVTAVNLFFPLTPTGSSSTNVIAQVGYVVGT